MIISLGVWMAWTLPRTYTKCFTMSNSYFNIKRHHVHGIWIIFRTEEFFMFSHAKSFQTPWRHRNGKQRANRNDWWIWQCFWMFFFRLLPAYAFKVLLCFVRQLDAFYFVLYLAGGNSDCLQFIIIEFLVLRLEMEFCPIAFQILFPSLVTDSTTYQHDVSVARRLRARLNDAKEKKTFRSCLVMWPTPSIESDASNASWGCSK